MVSKMRIQAPVITKSPLSLRTNVSEKSSKGSAFELLESESMPESEGSISSVAHEPKEQNSDTIVNCEEPDVKVKHVGERSSPESESIGGEVKPLYHNRKHINKRERCHVDPAASNKVKFSINSFKVPKMCFELPETWTVGLLKRTVMDAVNGVMLGGELRVGLLFEGKKVIDNNRTLQEMGISHNCDLGTLGFTLDSSFLEASPSPIQQEPQLSSASPITDVGCSSIYRDLETYLDKYTDKNQESIPKKTEVLTEEKVADSKALAPVTAVTTKAQRRNRILFTISEVEALVEAVENFGLGRWSEVKKHAFSDAHHRTCMDLKNKWKSLAHTASILPQQRRGELVPQHLLDRVLAAIQHDLKRQSELL